MISSVFYTKWEITSKNYLSNQPILKKNILRTWELGKTKANNRPYSPAARSKAPADSSGWTPRVCKRLCSWFIFRISRIMVGLWSMLPVLTTRWRELARVSLWKRGFLGVQTTFSSMGLEARRYFLAGSRYCQPYSQPNCKPYPNLSGNPQQNGTELSRNAAVPLSNREKYISTADQFSEYEKRLCVYILTQHPP